jgi:hypothetical protein
MRKFEQFNESVRDMMAPKSKDDMMTQFKGLTDRQIIDKLMFNEEVLKSLYTTKQITKMLQSLPATKYLRYFSGLSATWLLKRLVKSRPLSDFNKKTLLGVAGRLADGGDWSLLDLMRQKEVEEKVNEGIREFMTPKSEEDIRKDVGTLNPDEQLKQAASGGSLSLVKDAIKKGAKDEYALVSASVNGHIDIVEYLIDEMGYDVDYQKGVPLRFAIANGRMEVVKSLLDRGADIHFHNENPLSTAISHSYWDIANYLIKRGADIGKLHNDLKSRQFEAGQQLVVNFMHNYMTESIRDYMTPRAEKDVLRSSEKLDSSMKINYGIKWNYLPIVKKGIEELSESTFSIDSKILFLTECLQITLDLEKNEIFQYLKSIFNLSQKVYDMIDKLVERIKFINKMHDKLRRNELCEVSECEFNFDVYGTYEFSVTLPQDEDSDVAEEYRIGTFAEHTHGPFFYISCEGQDPDDFDTAEELEKILRNSYMWADEMNESVRHHMTPKPMTEISNNVVDNILKDYTDHAMYFTNRDRFGLDKLGLSHHTGDGFMNSLRKKFGKGLYLHVDDDSDDVTRKYLYNLGIDYTPIMSTTYKILGYDVRRMVKKLVEEVINENLPMIMIRKFNE